LKTKGGPGRGEVEGCVSPDFVSIERGRFYKPNDARDELFGLVALYREEGRKFSDEYYKILSYYSLANYPSNNFTFRKGLYYEGIRGKAILSLLGECLASGKSFSALAHEHIKGVLAKAAKGPGHCGLNADACGKDRSTQEAYSNR